MTGCCPASRRFTASRIGAIAGAAFDFLLDDPCAGAIRFRRFVRSVRIPLIHCAPSSTQARDHNRLACAGRCNSLREQRFTSMHEGVNGKRPCRKVAHLATCSCSGVVQALPSCGIRAWMGHASRVWNTGDPSGPFPCLEERAPPPEGTAEREPYSPIDGVRAKDPLSALCSVTSEANHSA
jgi:hypothetical protein